MLMDWLFLAFVGPTGSGKTTARKMAEEILQEQYGFRTVHLDVGAPLHAIQQYAYATMKLELREQDPTLLGYLAKHFGAQLPKLAIKRLREMMATFADEPRLAILNADCRDNAYADLQAIGFRFIRVVTYHGIRRDRLRYRDGESFEESKLNVEDTSSIITPSVIWNNGTLHELQTAIANELPEFVGPT